MDEVTGLPKVRWIEDRPPASRVGALSSVPYDRQTVRLHSEKGGVTAVCAAAARYPEKLAVFDGKLALTYAEFIDRVNGLAERLMSQRPESAILASITHNSAASPVIIMATAMAGHLLVPIDAGHPPQRQAAIFKESGAAGIIIEKGGDVDLSFIPANLPVVTIDPSQPSHAAEPQTRYDPDAPLFVAFSSGSTGRPKGIAAGGRYGAALLGQFIERYHINSDDVVLNLASLSVGGSRDAFVALSSGATMRICDIRGGLSEILRVMSDEGVTILSFIPAALRMVLSVPGAEEAFRHLRVLDLHGESIPSSDISLFRKKLPRDCLISVTMGSVEAGAVFSWFVEDAKIDGASVPVGYLLPERRVALIDETGASVSTGEIGELLVRGPMALGAWRGGKLVAGPFLLDPDDPGSRIYPMGDLVRQRPDGLFEFIGRKDRRVKIHGLWADLDEVEVALRNLDDVLDVAVVAASKSGEGDRLVAFLVLEDGTTPPSLGEIRQAVGAATAEHMAPAEVHYVGKIPRLPNFKPDLVRLDKLAAESLNDANKL
jgi:acyl-coenzyme A synthetase/AMP-(fatty) acid ligase